MNQHDKTFAGIPWASGGRSRAGADCVGVALLWLDETLGIRVALGKTPETGPVELENRTFDPAKLERGDTVFFANESGKIRHCAVFLGDNRLLHTAGGFQSRIETGFTLLRRSGLRPVAAVKPNEVELLARSLGHGEVGWGVVFSIVLSLALSVASSFLRPKAPQQKNQTGRYGFDQIFTAISTQVPLSLVMGAVANGGNSPYQTLVDKNVAVTDATVQKTNRVVVFQSGPLYSYTHGVIGTLINNTRTNAYSFYSSGGTNGFKTTPAQTKAEAVDGTIGGLSNRPSITFYDGAHGITVPVDIRAQYDRGFPIYGFSGAAYAVYRLIDSTKFSSFNVLSTAEGQMVRDFNSSGFTSASTSSSFTGNGTTVRFKLSQWDIKMISSVTVGGVSYSPISASAQTGNVYQPNMIKGYVEFVTAPAAAAAIVVSFTHYIRVWSQNPIAQLIYLLTEEKFGKGFPETKIEWVAAAEARDYCDASVTWNNANGTFTGARFTSNYSLDYRKKIQEHLQTILDSFYGFMFLSNGKVVIRARKAETPVFDFDEGSIILDSFQSQQPDRSQQPNRVNLFYHGIESLNAEDGVVLDDPADQANRPLGVGDNGVVETTLKIPAVDSSVQASRLAAITLAESTSRKWLANFKTNIQGIALQPGDVITVTHSSQPDWSQKLFRVEFIAADSNDILELQCSEYFSENYL